MRKVLFLIPTFNAGGGVEHLLGGLQRALPDAGWDPVFALAKGKRFHDPDRFRAAHPEFVCVEVDGTSGYRRQRRRSLVRAIREVAPDVAVPLRLFDAYGALAELKLSGYPLRVMTSIRGCYPRLIEDVTRYGAFIDVAGGASRLINALLEHHAGFPVERLVLMPTGVRPVASPRPKERTARLQVGYVGRIDESEKRCSNLAELADILDREEAAIDLHIYGSGPYEERLKAAMDRPYSSITVRFHGWKDTDALYSEAYPSLEVGLLFSPVEGNPISPREGMLHGVIPVLSRFRGCLREGLFVHDQNALLFTPLNMTECARHLLRLVEDAALRERLSDAARTLDPCYIYETALTRWVDALNLAMEGEVRTGERMPDYQPRGTSRIEGLLPAGLVDLLRRVGGRSIDHGDSGGEWPHGGSYPQGIDDEIIRLAQELDVSV